MTSFDSFVAGIPCQVQIDYYHQQNPIGQSADSDWDCYGYTECDYTVLDRRGRPAPWLARKATGADDARIQSEIEDFLKKE